MHGPCWRSIQLLSTLARMCAADYRGELPVLARLDIAGVTATLTERDGLVVYLLRGTDSLRDWADFDLQIGHAVEQGDTRVWHAGMLRYGRVCYAFAKGWLEAGRSIDLVLGHSLGAGALQVVAPSLRIRGVGFAAPRPLYSLEPPDGAELVELHCATDDLVCYAPPTAHHVGEVRWHKPRRRRAPLKAHDADSYGDLLQAEGL